MLDPEQRRIAGVAALARVAPLDALHFITHGTDGAVQLGDVWLQNRNIGDYAPALAAWREALAPDADILLYGCDIADDAEGRAFVDALHALTGADVAASTNATGNFVAAGDWRSSTRRAPLRPALSPGPGQVSGPASLPRSPSARPPTCSTAPRPRSRRCSAIPAPTARSRCAKRSSRPTGQPAPTRSSCRPASTGSPLRERGPGSDGRPRHPRRADDHRRGQRSDRDRWQRAGPRFHVLNNSTVTMSNMTVTGGTATQNGGSAGGGGAVVIAGSTLNLSAAVLSANSAVAQGGADPEPGHAQPDRRSAHRQFRRRQPGRRPLQLGGREREPRHHRRQQRDVGGGIYNTTGGNLTLTNVTISGNSRQPPQQGGGIYNVATLTATNVTITGNSAAVGGGGIFRSAGTTHAEEHDRRRQHRAQRPGCEWRHHERRQQSHRQHERQQRLGGERSPERGVGLDATLRFNGGPTPTHALLAGSAAINAGTSVGAPAARPAGHHPRRDADIGAYEVAATPNTAPVLTGSQRLCRRIIEDDIANAGMLVSALIAGHASDPDAGALSGIAVGGRRLERHLAVLAQCRRRVERFSFEARPRARPGCSRATRTRACGSCPTRELERVGAWRAYLPCVGPERRSARRHRGDDERTAARHLTAARLRAQAITVTPVNDAPAGANRTVTLTEDTRYTFVAADFAMTDAADSPPNAALAVKIATLPLLGQLTCQQRRDRERRPVRQHGGYRRRQPRVYARRQRAAARLRELHVSDAGRRRHGARRRRSRPDRAHADDRTCQRRERSSGQRCRQRSR